MEEVFQGKVEVKEEEVPHFGQRMFLIRDKHLDRVQILRRMLASRRRALIVANRDTLLESVLTWEFNIVCQSYHNSSISLTTRETEAGPSGVRGPGSPKTQGKICVMKKDEAKNNSHVITG